MGFKDWFQKKLKQQFPQNDLTKPSHIREEKNLREISTDKLSTADTPKIEFQSSSKEEKTFGEKGSKFKAINEKLEVKAKDEEDIQVQESQMSIDSDNNIHSANTSEDYVLAILRELPELWTGKEMKLHIIGNVKDTTSIMKRVLHEIERGLIRAEFRVKDYDHLCDMVLILRVAEALTEFPAAVTAINPVLSYLLESIKTEAILSRRKRLMR